MGLWDFPERIKSWRAGYMPRLSRHPIDGPTRKVIEGLMLSGEAPGIIIGSEDVDIRDIGIQEPPKRFVGRGEAGNSGNIWDWGD